MLDPWKRYHLSDPIESAFPTVPVLVSEILAFPIFPSRRSWGEAWWTARDLCFTNRPDPIAGTEYEGLVNDFIRRADERFIFGDGSATLEGSSG